GGAVEPDDGGRLNRHHVSRHRLKQRRDTQQIPAAVEQDGGGSSLRRLNRGSGEAVRHHPDAVTRAAADHDVAARVDLDLSPGGQPGYYGWGQFGKQLSEVRRSGIGSVIVHLNSDWPFALGRS